MGAQGNKISNFTAIEKTQVKSSCVRFHFVKFEAFEVCFFGLPQELSLEGFHITYYLKKNAV